MDVRYQIGALLVALALFSVTALAGAGPQYGAQGVDNDTVNGADAGGPVNAPGPQGNQTQAGTLTQTQTGTQAQTGTQTQGGAQNQAGTQAQNQAGTQAQNQLGNQTQNQAGNGAAGLTGHQRAIQAITQAQERLAEKGVTAPGHQVALGVLGAAQDEADDAEETSNEDDSAAKNRMAIKLAKKAEQMNQGELTQIQNEYQERVKTKAQLGEVGDDELEDEIDEGLGGAEAAQLKNKIKAMNREFKGKVYGILNNGTEAERQQLKLQLQEMDQTQTAEKIKQMGRERIRQLLMQGESVQGIALAA